MFGKNAWSLLFLWVAIIGVMTVATSASGPAEMGEYQTYLPVLHRAPSAPVSIALAIAADDRDGYENQDFYLSGDINESNTMFALFGSEEENIRAKLNLFN